MFQMVSTSSAWLEHNRQAARADRAAARAALKERARVAAADARRVDRYDRLRAVRIEGERRAMNRGWRSVPFARQCHCQMAMQDVSIVYSPKSGTAYGSGIATCGSVWACPVCSAKVRASRTEDVKTLAKWHTANGGLLVMVTLTIAHANQDALADLVNGLSESWRRVQRGLNWAAARSLLVGQTRTLEVTHGFADGEKFRNGWHPHLHLLLLAHDAQAAAGLLDYWATSLGDDWSDAAAAELGESHRPKFGHGIRAQIIDADGAEYVTKLSQEVTRSDLKSGARQPWSLVDDKRWGLWSEYCAAMHGKRAVVWSNGLRALCGLSAVEPTDDELAAKLQVDGEIVAYMAAHVWNRMVKDGTIAAYLVHTAVICRARSPVLAAA